MFQESSTALKRDVKAVRIPSGEQIILPEGNDVIITQALGGAFTVVVAHQPGLFRIQGSDADALGREVTEAGAPEEGVPHEVVEGEYNEELVWDQLRNCYDPEIPVNIVDLGLIYGLESVEDESGKGKRINIQMTLTAPGCGMGPTLAADAERRILTLPGVASANVELVWEPQWSPDRISEAGRDKLGMA